jgi:hypothetical protein
MKLPPLEYPAIHRFVEDLTGDELHPKQVDALAHAVAGAIHADTASIAAIGRGAARAREVSEKHSIKQVDRLLANSKIDPFELMKKVIPVIIAERPRAVIAVDWTEFASDAQSTIVASLISDHGRATPLLWLTVPNAKLRKRRNSYEDRLLWGLRMAIPARVNVVILADRGFADSELLWALKDTFRFDYVVRFKAGTIVESVSGESKPAGEWVPSNGQVRCLSSALITRKRTAIPCVVCVKRAGMKESWCLATSLANVPGEVIELYSRRFDIEHSFRDQKDWRFGLGLDHMTLGTAARRDRMLLVLALAAMFTTLVGAAGERLGLDRLLRANTVSRRTHSLVRQGREYMSGVARALIVDIRCTFQILWKGLRANDRTYATL